MAEVLLNVFKSCNLIIDFGKIRIMKRKWFNIILNFISSVIIIICFVFIISKENLRERFFLGLKILYRLLSWSSFLNGLERFIRKSENNNHLLNKSGYPQSVADAVAAITEDWDAEDTEFSYDPNGNVTRVVENGAAKFDTIDYDHRNLPVRLVNRHEREGYATNATNRKFLV